ncbi:MAG: hypothetical protein PUC77_08125 [Bacteroidales bacterium]|nr:hypothetical protein [Bacteroidales bacterium]MDD6141858.1 hypothetical protein [Bacteroidales bacterium]MDD6622120.1 hypothetical protein [Bacteroidales bacterium]MDD6669935.1 hypothetical protein [Bacteroidales bacterium]
MKQTLLVLVAASALALTACTKSADSLRKQAAEIVTEQGTVPADRFDEAVDLYEEILDRAIPAFENINLETGDGMEEAAKLSDAMETIHGGIYTTLDKCEDRSVLLSEEAAKRIEEKEKKFEEAYHGFMFGK